MTLIWEWPMIRGASFCFTTWAGPKQHLLEGLADLLQNYCWYCMVTQLLMLTEYHRNISLKIFWALDTKHNIWSQLCNSLYYNNEFCDIYFFFCTNLGHSKDNVSFFFQRFWNHKKHVNFHSALNFLEAHCTH